MARRQLIIIGIAVVVVLLLASGSALLILRPWEGAGHSEASVITTEPGDTTVTLTWQAIPGENSYFVYRDGGQVPLNPTPVKETRYEDIGLSNGRTYSYEVAAVDSAGVPGKRTAKVQAVPGSK